MNSIKDLIRTLSNNGNNQVLNLSRSHLSVLFSKVGLTDLCSGVSTSNKRTARISSGGPVGNPIKIYVDKLKKVIRDENKKIIFLRMIYNKFLWILKTKSSSIFLSITSDVVFFQ